MCNLSCPDNTSGWEMYSTHNTIEYVFEEVVAVTMHIRQ